MESMSQPFDFEPVPQCMLCGSEERHDVPGVAWRGVAFSYCLCARCGLKYMNPRPTVESYQRFFLDEYWQSNMAGRGFPSAQGYDDPSIDQMERRMPKYRQVYARIRQHLEETLPLTAETRALEVGCAFGYTLEWLHRDRGVQVFGIEPSAESIERCHAAGCIELVARTAEEYLFAGEPADAQRYDVILFSHCLETLADPMPVLRGVRQRLAPGGIVLLYVANVEYFDAMAPYCPFIYSPETLSRMLRLCGLEPSRLIHSPTPVDRATAVRVVNPNYQIVAFASAADHESPVEAPRIQPVEIARQHWWGNHASTWSELSVQDMFVRTLLRLKERLRRGL